MPDEAGKLVLARIDEVERACDKADPGAIEAATIKLAEAASYAISAVYLVAERNVTKAEDRAAAARESERHPATSPP